MKRMDRLTRLVLALLPALWLAGCTGLDPEVTGASLLAYWSESSSAVDCPDALGCVDFAESLEDFEGKVTAKRLAGMELVRLDAHKHKSTRLYAGAWETSAPGAGEHVYETALHPNQFETLNSNRVGAGYRLVHVSLWRDGATRRVAAIWRPETTEEARQPDDVVEVGLAWDQLYALKGEYEAEGLFLDDIEVDPTSAEGEDPFLIAVWRPGTFETALLKGQPCSIRGEPIEPDAAVAAENNPVCKMPTPSEAETRVSEHCQILTTVEALAHNGLHPVDFEPYSQDGVGHLAVLLQERGEMDWLTVPGSWHAVHCRHELLGDDPALGAQSANRVGLLDFDLVGLGPKTPVKGLHNGLVHDGGTAGGPPGGSGLVSADVAASENDAEDPAGDSGH